MPGCKRVLAHAPWTVVPAPTPPTSQRPDRPRVDARRGRASRLAPGGHDQESGAGREERPARPPPTAARRLAGLATMPCGVSETGFAAIRTPLSSSVRRGNPRFLPRQVRGWSSEAPALGRSVHHAGQGIGLRPPAPSLGRGPAGEPTPHLRGRRTMPRSERAVTYCVHIVSIESYYPRGASLAVPPPEYTSPCTRRHRQVPAKAVPFRPPCPQEK